MKKFGEINLNNIDPELKEDPIFRLKYIAFCMGAKPSLEDKISLEDFAQFARFQLSATYGIPFRADIWDKYTTEELIIEFYALKFFKEDDYSKEFEARLSGEYQADFDWMQEQIDKNKEEVKDFLNMEKEFPKEIKFSSKDK